jgi:hypothetical protein
MDKCPLVANPYGQHPYCVEECVLYNNECLIKKALETYINANKTMVAYSTPTNPNRQDWYGNVSSQFGGDR